MVHHRLLRRPDPSASQVLSYIFRSLVILLAVAQFVEEACFRCVRVLFSLSSLRTSSTSPPRFARLAWSLPQPYHQATAGLGRWRALSLYALATSGRSPRPSSSPSPSLRFWAFFFSRTSTHSALPCLPAAAAAAERSDNTTFAARHHQPTTGSRRWGALSPYVMSACRRPPLAASVAVQTRLQRLCSVPSPRHLCSFSRRIGRCFARSRPEQCRCSGESSADNVFYAARPRHSLSNDVPGSKFSSPPPP